MKSVAHNKLGVNLIGFFKARTGLGEMTRLTDKALQCHDTPINQIVSEASFAFFKHLGPFQPQDTSLPYPINLYIIGQRHIIEHIGVNRYGLRHLNLKYSICIWYWESDEIPKGHLECLDYMDEIWVVSRYMQKNLEKYTTKKVSFIPQPFSLEHKLVHPLGKKDFGLSESFMFLFSFDFLSVEKRKNPGAIIKAFVEAFPKEKNVQLVIKSQNGKETLQSLSYYRLVKEDSRITWIDESMDQNKLLSLVNACDCYISLHRSEGFGLTIAEAMRFGKPAIATGYSGNLEFMNDDNAYLCSYSLVPVGKRVPTFPENGTWAEPDIKHAASLMKHVYNNIDEAREKGQRGKKHLEENHSPEYVGKLMASRLAEIPLPHKKKSSVQLVARHHLNVMKYTIQKNMRRVLNFFPLSAQGKIKKVLKFFR